MTNSTFTLADFKVGQSVTYGSSNSVFTGEVVKVSHQLVIIECKAGMKLWNAGYSVGACVEVEQVISIN